MDRRDRPHRHHCLLGLDRVNIGENSSDLWGSWKVGRDFLQPFAIVPPTTASMDRTLCHGLFLCHPLGLVHSIEMDGKDVDCNHFLIFTKKQPIGTARLQRGGKIERVSILKPSRKKGLGSKLMRFIINSAKKKEFERVYLHSQMGSIDFYKAWASE